MSISSLFQVPEHLTIRQANWLSMCAVIPCVKASFGDDVSSEDELLAQEAKGILASRAQNRTSQ